MHSQTRRKSRGGAGPFPGHMRSHRSTEWRAGNHGSHSFQTGHSPIGGSGIEGCQPAFTVFEAAFAPSPSRLKRVRDRRAAAGHDPGDPSLQVVQRADGPFRGQTESGMCPRRWIEVQMPLVDHHPATGRHSSGSSTPRRTDDFHGQDGNPSPDRPECCEEHPTSIQTGLRLRDTAQQSRTHPVASGTDQPWVSIGL